MERIKRSYALEIGENGFRYVTLESVGDDALSLPYGSNSKVGKAMTLSFPIEYTCDHRCECYREKKCYGCGGCYLFGSNQEKYTRNLKFYLNQGGRAFIAAVVDAITDGKVKRFRYFGVGDIPNYDFVGVMVEIARQCPGVEFWGYTKKYRLVNRWIDENGELPENLCIIFSHWMNEDGTFFPMENPHNMPRSEFVPFGMEDTIDLEHGHVCPCSDPDFIGTCADCEHPCSRLKKGEAMYLKEHSTAATKERDAALRAARAEKKKSA